MSGDAHDPGSAARPEHDPVLIWNGLVTRVRRSGGQRRGRAPDTAAEALQAKRLGMGTGNELVPEPTPIDLDLP